MILLTFCFLVRRWTYLVYQKWCLCIVFHSHMGLSDKMNIQIKISPLIIVRHHSLCFTWSERFLCLYDASCPSTKLCTCRTHLSCWNSSDTVFSISIAAVAPVYQLLIIVMLCHRCPYCRDIAIALAFRWYQRPFLGRKVIETPCLPSLVPSRVAKMASPQETPR